jgi:uncharacterized protein (TIRG00374 family)
VTRPLVKRLVLLAVAGVSLYLVGPAVLELFSSWPRVKELDPFLLQLIVLAQVAAYACLWVVVKIALRSREWLPVITSQLAGNAAARVLPGGGAAGGALQYSMLVRAGLPAATTARGVTAASLLVTGIVFTLPALALPAVLGGAPIDRQLARAAWAGVAALVLLTAAGALLLLSDGPLRQIGRALQAARNRIRRRHAPRDDLPGRLLRERDLILEVFNERWLRALLATVARWGFDYGSLLLALLAVGARPAPSAVLLAFCAAQVLGLIPFTPGGLGFVEAGLTGTLALAGVAGAEALVAALAYRLASYWLPIPFGLGAYFLHRRIFSEPQIPARA